MAKAAPTPKRASKRPSRDAPVVPDVPATEKVRRLYLAALGAILAIACWDLWGQVPALYGPNGLAPIDAWLTQADAVLVARGVMPGPEVVAPDWLTWGSQILTRTWARLTHAPTLLWWLPSGAAAWLCALGTLAGGVVMSGRFAAPALLVGWASYLSLCTVGDRFLAYQWDTLLTEVLFASLLIAPWGAKARHAASPWALVLLRWILVRLVFFGGLVKLTSGDALWRSLTALTVHFETQPLPGPWSWHAHQLPWVVLVAGAALTFLVELVLVWGVLGTRKARHVGAGATAALMVLLMLTGNFGTFQLLTLTLCLACLEDRDLGKLGAVFPKEPVMPPLAPWPRRGVQLGVVLLIALSLVGMGPRFAGTTLPEPLERVRQAAAPWRTVNHYGLFAVMTPDRPLPVLEAKWGDQPWTEITWRYQTSDPAARPSQVAPFMPRLDWQLWFAGLGTCEQNDWLRRLGARVLAGDEAVAARIGDMRLLTSAPPDAVRFARYVYRFAEADGTGWWTRERDGLYCPEQRR